MNVKKPAGIRTKILIPTGIILSTLLLGVKQATVLCLIIIYYDTSHTIFKRYIEYKNVVSNVNIFTGIYFPK